MALWGKTSADADKPKWLTSAQKANTELTEAGWVFTQPNGTKELLVALGDADPTPPGPVNTVLPAITGTARVAQALTVNNGTWTGTAPSYARVWQTADAATGPWTDTTTTTTTYTPGAGANQISSCPFLLETSCIDLGSDHVLQWHFFPLVTPTTLTKAS